MLPCRPASSADRAEQHLVPELGPYKMSVYHTVVTVAAEACCARAAPAGACSLAAPFIHAARCALKHPLKPPRVLRQQTFGGTRVDFVLEQPGGGLVLVEVKNVVCADYPAGRVPEGRSKVGPSLYCRYCAVASWPA